MNGSGRRFDSGARVGKHLFTQSAGPAVTAVPQPTLRQADTHTAASPDRHSPGLAGIARHVLLRPFNDPTLLDDVLRGINRLWSLGAVRARVVAVIDETPDTRTFVLRPNRHWQGARAGQHVVVEMEIDGARRQRAFSLSAPSARGGEVRLTVRRHATGNATAWMHARLRVGAVVTLGQAQGDFVLPDALPPRLLLVGAGSGITPLRAMLLDLQARDYAGDVVLVHASRDRDDAIFGAELQALAQAWPALRLVQHHSAVDGRLDAATLARAVPDFAQRDTFLCGPAPLMAWMEALYAAHDASARLSRERYGLPLRARAPGDTAVQVHVADSARMFTSTGDEPLLVAAESAGLRPAYGCRMGICMTCQCRKRSGTVVNLLTGRESSAPGELIQLCISAARSDVELELP